MGFYSSFSVRFLLLAATSAVFSCSQAEDTPEKARSLQDVNPVARISSSASLTEVLELDRRVELASRGPDGTLGDIDEVLTYHDGYIVMDRLVARRVLYFDHQGRYVTMVGRHGEGPGEYSQPTCVAVNSQGEIVIENCNPPDYHIYRTPGEFVETIPATKFDRVVDARRIIPAEDGYYLYSPMRGGKRVLKVDRSFDIQCEFSDVELGARDAAYDGGDIALSPSGIVWVAGIWRPTISLFSADGRFIREVGHHLLERDFMLSEELLRKAAQGGPVQTLRLIEGLHAIQKIMRLGRIMLVGHFVYDGCQHYDVYDAEGNLLGEQMPFCVKWQRLVSASDERLIAAVTAGPELEESDSTVAILYIYRMKDELH